MWSLAGETSLYAEEHERSAAVMAVRYDVSAQHGLSTPLVNIQLFIIILYSGVFRGGWAALMYK